MIPVEKVKSIINTLMKPWKKNLASSEILIKKTLLKNRKNILELVKSLKKLRGYFSFQKEKEELLKIIDEQNAVIKKCESLATK